MKKKVGIMSMQRVYNYGSFLQGYALKTMIEELGCDVEFVDYKVGKCIVDNLNKNTLISKIICKSKIISKLAEYMGYDAPFKEKIKFILYKKNYARKNFPILGINDKPNYNPKLDVLIIGSDEVFNCVQNNKNVGYSIELFGANNNADKLISYAGSFGNTTIDKLKEYNIDTEVGSLLNKFDAISVRDKNSGNIVRTLTNKEPYYHLDPVLVYDYMNKCNKIPKNVCKRDYIILYGYSGRFSKTECNIIKDYSKKNNKKIYCIGGVQSICDKFIDCSPFEVLSYFKHADAVITDTFHGTIFSIITKRNFITLVRKSDGTRYGNEEKLTDLLDRLKLSNRIINDINELEQYFSRDINYNETDKILEMERIKAKEYLKENIKD